MKNVAAGALALAACVAGASAARAQDVVLKPLIDARLRYEHVDQQGIADTADAVTLRVRSGVQASTGPFSALVESESTLAIGPHYNDGYNGKPLPVVGDAENIELNRAQLRYADHGVGLTAGRQLVELGDQRFVGSANWRQNRRTFDAVRGQWAVSPRLAVDATYSWSVRDITGIQGTPERPQAIDGNFWFGTVAYTAPLGTLSGFAYLLDERSNGIAGARLSSQTYGGRYAGTQTFGGAWKLGYIASVARQSDYARNPNRYAATYWLGEATLSRKALSGTVGYEALGAARGDAAGRALTSVQTPLGSIFGFQGWADKFATTPPDGVRDGYVTVGANWKHAGALSGYGISASFHRFDSDRMSRHYGDELDVVAQAKIARYTVGARYAHYRADAFATDTDKLWLSVEWVFN
ncbi:alginate export family protein [Sphingomonas sp. NFR15]|uniref:alginate export family protein n=1 Tax=Sphingomonas sp. NFR15 TaxID=1566282 RepID=UPI0008810F07|nr:alginate export family protein [Sphingomonas sp. NFR15]SDA22580.1 Alginate export [Sphingomonas sp. NFR15]